MPNPAAQKNEKPIINMIFEFIRATMPQPMPNRPSPRLSVKRGPLISAIRPEKGAIIARIIRPAAPTDEMKLADQPNSSCHTGMTNPSAERAENESASAKNPKTTIAQFRVDVVEFCVVMLASPNRLIT